MKFDLSPVDWRSLLRAPLSLGLLVSLCLHLAAAFLLQPVPGSGTPRTVVISARLETVPLPETTASPDMAESEPLPAPSAEPMKPLESTPHLTTVPASPVAPWPAPEAPTIATAPAAPPMSTQAASAPTKNDTENNAARPPAELPTVALNYDPTWYQARQVDSHPRNIERIEPKYPEEARRRNLEGSVKLMLKIDDLGRVRDAEVVEAQPPGVFDEAALAAFRDARFHPAMRDGRPVRYQAYFRVEFKLE